MPIFAALITSQLRRLAARASDQAGLTLIEVVVAALIIALISVGTATALIATAHASGDEQLRSQASAILAQDQERLRGLTAEQLAQLGSSGSQRTVQVGQTTYTVTSTAAFQDIQGNSSCSSTAVDYFQTTSTVGWNESFHAASGQAQSLTAQSVLSRPVTGDLEASVTDQTGAAVPGVTVTATPSSQVSGQSAETALTDGTGCAVLTGLQAANYSLSIGKNSYVDTSDASPTAQNAAVTATATPATPTDVLGLAGTINASFGTYNSAGGEANAISFSGSGNTLSSPAVQTASASPSTSAASTLTASNLFPFNKTFGTGSPSYTNNWTVYAGSCSFQAPPTSSQTQFTVAPGATTSAATGLPASAPSGATSVQEPFLKLSSITGLPLLGVPRTVQPTDIVLTYSNGSCKDQYEASIATPASGAGLGATPPANGWLANPGQPYAPTGDLTVCADYGLTVGALTTWYSQTVPASNTSMTSANTVPPIVLTLGSRCAGAS